MENQEIEWLLHEKYQGVKSDVFHADCARLAAGEPLAYLIGHVPFLDCTINLNSHPLIPRVETEFWVEQAIATIISSAANLRGRTPLILDLCAGSGAIGIAVAKVIPGASVTFAEIDPAHLPTIEKNVELNLPINGNTLVIESDLFSQIPAGQTFDYILTNPPYIDAAANTVAVDVATHEPHLALFGGALGMDIIARIIADAPNYLTPTGQLWIEHEPAQVAAIATLATEHSFVCVTHEDQYGVARFSVLTMAQ